MMDPHPGASYEELRERVLELEDERRTLLAESNAVRTMIREAVNASCSCGGRGPHDNACPACMVWHRLITRGVVTP